MKALPFTILYFGSNSPASTSRHRADALRRLGCEVTVVDTKDLMGPRRRWQAFVDYRTGYRFLQRRLLRVLKATEGIRSLSADLIWVDSGEIYGPRVLKWISSHFACPIILYNVDDPVGPRDASRFQRLKASLSCYSLCVFIRQETSLEALALGLRRVLTVHRSYDENVHTQAQFMARQAPHPVVSFIGTLIPGEPRDRFLAALMRAGLPMRLIGNQWQRSSLWPVLQTIYQGPGRTGVAYSEALGDAAVTLGFLSHQNRDLVTTRSFETPACGGLFCAERTSEHQLLYEDGWEAVFWDSVEECILQCNKLLGDPELRQKICTTGAQHVREIGVGNEDICRQILASI
jgi:spore maturation protein CgeB